MDEIEDELARSVIEDDKDDSYEELQHSLPMDFNNEEGTKQIEDHWAEKPDRLDQLLAQETPTDRFTTLYTQSPSASPRHANLDKQP